MTLIRTWIAAVMLCLLATTAHAQQTVRIGVFVGNNVGLGQDAPLRSAEREARELAVAFQQLGDLSRERTYVLTGVDGPTVERTLRAVDGQVREAQARGSKVLLLFYYTGHASRDGLHLKGTTLPMSRLRNWLDHHSADVRVAFVDACESGTLARVRGGTPVETIDLRVADTLGTSGLAIITSSGPLSVARESEQFGGGVFSQALISGLRGGADTDEDGAVTLEEAYEFSFSETVRDTARAGHGVQRPEFRRALTGVGDVVLTRLADRSAGLVLPTELEGVYTIVSVNTGQVVARIDKAPGEHKRLALPSGRYIVRKVRAVDVLVAELDLAWGGDKWVDDARMTVLPLGDPLARGGAPFDRPHRLWLGIGAGSPLVAKNGAPVGVELGLRVRLAGSLGLSLGVASELAEASHGYTLSQLIAPRGSVGLSSLLQFRRVDLTIGASLHVQHLSQYVWFEVEDERELTEVRRQTTATASGDLDLHLPLGGAVGLLAGTQVFLIPAEVDDQLALRGQLRGRVGLAFRIGGRRRGKLKRGRGEAETKARSEATAPPQ